jgi:TolB-like protein/DNA-binding winged helix-turn-helix (wHTH) protein/tetratricopeptide (TPR) repeat protein
MGKPGEVLANVFRFDGFCLDAAHRTLHRGGVEVELRPKCFDLLTCLARNAPRVVTKDELIEAVWPGVVVTDESLTRCVSDIRHALGDGGQQIVKTVPRRGYLLAAPLSFDEPQAQPGPVGALQTAGNVLSVAAAPAAVPRSGRPAALSPAQRWLAAGAIAALAAVAAAGVAIWMRAGSPPAGSTQALSIVVLPLVERSGDPDQAWFAEGLTEDLTTDLTRIPGSFVIARSSAETYRGKVVDVRQVGRELGVRYVLEGSVQRLGDQLRLNLRLVDAENGQQLWADRLDGARRDLATMQSQVTGIVANALHQQLIESESQRGQRLRPLNPDAQDLVWQAFSAYERRTPDKNAQARELAQRAVALDPSSVLGWSMLGLSYACDVGARWLNLRGATLQQWQRLAEAADAKAYAIDPNNLYAVQLRAEVLKLQGKVEESLAMRERAVAINRNNAPAWGGLSYTYVTLGRTDDSIAAGLEAIRLSPRDNRLYSFQVVIAAAHLFAGRDAEALGWARRSIEARPEYSIPHAWAAAAAANLGDMATARAEIAEFRRLQPDYTPASFKAEQRWYSEKPEFLRQRERFYQGLHKAGLTD